MKKNILWFIVPLILQSTHAHAEDTSKQMPECYVSFNIQDDVKKMTLNEQKKKKHRVKKEATKNEIDLISDSDLILYRTFKKNIREAKNRAYEN